MRKDWPVKGQAIMPAAAFPGGFSAHLRVLVSRKSRLKAGCSHDWLPHCSCRQTPIDKTMRHYPYGRGSVTNCKHAGTRYRAGPRGRPVRERIPPMSHEIPRSVTHPRPISLHQFAFGRMHRNLD
jgi:hypothetical protein